jgi:hypothetical protein
MASSVLRAFAVLALCALFAPAAWAEAAAAEGAPACSRAGPVNECASAPCCYGLRCVTDSSRGFFSYKCV